MQTDFTRMMGIEHAILLAPMGGAVTLELALAVGAAGAFPMFGVSWDQPEAAGCPPSGQRPREGEPVASQAGGAALLRYSDDTAKRGATGDIEATCLYAGQSAGLVRDVVPAGELGRRLAAETDAALGWLAGLRR